MVYLWECSKELEFPGLAKGDKNKNKLKQTMVLHIYLKLSLGILFTYL